MSTRPCDRMEQYGCDRSFIYDLQRVTGSKLDEGQHRWNDTGCRDVRGAGYGVSHPNKGAIVAT